jgi:uncharacterized membrane protein
MLDKLNTLMLGVLVFVWAFDAAAQPLGIYKVKNVASNDVLNIRAGAGSAYLDIGDLAHDGKIQVIGFNEDGNWAKIKWTVQEGWVSARYLELVSEYTSLELPNPLNCGGTEPFWAAQLTSNRLVYSMMDEDEAVASIEQAVTARGVVENYIIGIVAGSFSGVLKKEICSDHMSDVDYPWSLVLINQSQKSTQVLEGCCR